MEKILYCIKTTKLYENRVNTIFNTWLTGIDDYIFYSEHEDESKNIIKVCEDGTYGGLEIKGLNFFNLIKTIETDKGENILNCYDWLFLVDDDTFVNVKNLNTFAKTADKNKAYGQIFTFEKDSGNPMFRSPGFDKSTRWYSGGAGILISSESLKKVDNYKNFNTNHDDVSIGINLTKNGIELIDSDLFNSEPPEVWGEVDEDIIKKITYHHLTEDRMYKLYSIVKSNIV